MGKMKKKKAGKKTTTTTPEAKPEATSMVIAADGFKGNSDLPRGFNWRRFDAYLFDIDGTLLNSLDAVHYEAFLTAMQEMYGRAVGLEGVPVQGSTDPIILLNALKQAGISEEDGRASLEAAMTRMCAEVETRSGDLRPVLCGCVKELLVSLKAQGKLLGVTSGNIERIGWAKLKAAGIDEFFSFGSFSDRNETRTEIFRWGAEEVCRRLGPDAKMCFLGDTPADVEAAKACGFPVIAVATGIFSLIELANAEPEMCIPSCQSLWMYA